MSKTDILYGIKPVIEAIRAGKEIDKIYILKNLEINKVREIKKFIYDRKIPFQYVPKEKLNRLTRQNHQGIVALISPIEYSDIETLLPGIFETGKVPFLLLLDNITDVRNMGAISRSAECAGVDTIILPTKGSAMINADAVKTSAGALNKIPVCRNSNLKETILYLKNSGIQIIAASEDAEKYYHKVDYTKPTAIIMGSEEKGVSEEYLKLCDEIIKIPMIGEIESLNVSVASGIILFEAVKQRM